ncbi:MAG: class F sortase [bacterium]|nr:class F sortase [bacterium]
MKANITARRIFLQVVLTCGVLFWALLVFSTPTGVNPSSSASLAENVVAFSAPAQTGISSPVRLTIPKISVDAVIVQVGVTELGAMDVPKDPADTAWFNLGPRPGEIGSAVISGHYGWKDNVPAVFDSLHEVQKGDKLYVEDEAGMKMVFIVREVRTFGENDDASEVFGSSDGKAHLNLITCEGEWNKARQSYGNRRIVFSDRE